MSETNLERLERDTRLRSSAREAIRYELEGAAKDGCTAPDYNTPGHESWDMLCHGRDVLSLLREVEELRRRTAEVAA